MNKSPRLIELSLSTGSDSKQTWWSISSRTQAGQMFWKQNHGHYAHASSSPLHPRPRPFQQCEACLTYDSGCLVAWYPRAHWNSSAILNKLHWQGQLNWSQRNTQGERVNYEIAPLPELPQWPWGGGRPISDLLLWVKPYLHFTCDTMSTSYIKSVT